MSISQQLSDLPLTELIVSLAKGIAQAQIELDSVSIEVSQMMSGLDDGSRVRIGKRTYSLLELGLIPTFYHFVETTLEIKMTVSMSVHGVDKRSESNKYSHHVSAVDASFSGKYQYSVEGSSLIRTRMVPVPPPPVFQNQIEKLMVEDRKYREESF